MIQGDYGKEECKLAVRTFGEDCSFPIIDPKGSSPVDHTKDTRSKSSAEGRIQE